MYDTGYKIFIPNIHIAEMTHVFEWLIIVKVNDIYYL